MTLIVLACDSDTDISVVDQEEVQNSIQMKILTELQKVNAHVDAVEYTVAKRTLKM